MSAVVLARLRDLFVAPSSAQAPATQVTARAIPSTLAVLATGPDASVAGAALGLAAAAELRSRCAVVCVWSGAAAHGGVATVALRDSAAPPPPGDTVAPGARRAASAPRAGIAAGAARRLAERLAARGLVAAARGRLVTVALPASDVEARAAAERALAAAGDVPVVLVVAGPRPPALDPLLAAVDRIVIVPPPDAPSGLEALAVDAAAHLGRSTAILRLPRTGAAGHHLLTATGLLVPPSLRTAATSALEGNHG